MRILSICTLAGALLLSTSVTAQVDQVEESFGSKTGTSYNWSLTVPTGSTVTREKADTRSIFNKVDEIVKASNIGWARTVTLSAGTYVAVARIEKFKNTTAGTDDFILSASGQSTITPVELKVADQKLDSFVYTRSLLFTVTTTFPVTFQLKSKTSSGDKENYRFDTFRVAKIERGRAVLVESLGRRWGHAWGCPHYEKEVRDTTSTYGWVEKLSQAGTSPCGSGSANLWWFRWNSGAGKTFLPGVHTAHMRIKKVVSTSGRHNFIWWFQKSTDGGTTWSAGTKVTWLASRQNLNEWVYSPNISFNVTSTTHQYRFRLDAFRADPLLKQTNSFKSNYHFDTFEVRRGEFESVGVSCMNNGAALMEGNVPQLRDSFDIVVSPLGATNTNPVTMIIGLNNPNVNLSAVGWAGCFQYAKLDILVGMTMGTGEATLSVKVPNDPNLINVKFWNQAYQPNSNAGLSTTNGVRGMVGN